MNRFLPSLILSLLLFWEAQANSDYRELLNIQPLTPSSLLASFNFWSNASLQSYEQQHFKFIPRSLGQILQHAKTQELHLRFSTGRWDDESWGPRPWQGTKEGGTGVELWAWVEADSDESFVIWIFSWKYTANGIKFLCQMDHFEPCTLRLVLRLAQFY